MTQVFVVVLISLLCLSDVFLVLNNSLVCWVKSQSLFAAYWGLAEEKKKKKARSFILLSFHTHMYNFTSGQCFDVRESNNSQFPPGTHQEFCYVHQCTEPLREISQY